MRRLCSMLLVACGAWAQQPAAKAPQKADAPVTRGSFSASGLRNEKVLTNLFVGDFVDIPFGRSNLAFVGLFEDYLEEYGRHCDAYLPKNKVEMVQSVCSVPETKADRYGTQVRTGGCLVYGTEGMGIYADPAVYAAKSKLSDEAGLSMMQDALQTMKQKNPLEAALNTLGATQQMTADMNAIFRLNSCTSPGLKRFQENIVLFSMGKPPIALPGVAPSVTPRPQPPSGGPFKDQNYTRLLEDLIQDQSQTWLMNRFVSGSTSNVVVASRDSAGRPAKIAGKYLFNGRSPGSVTLSFSDGLPECLYFFDFPSTCKTPNRRIVAAYASGSYPQSEPGIVQRSTGSAPNPAPLPPAAPPVQAVAPRAAPPQAVPPPPSAPATTVNPAGPPAPSLTLQQQREQRAAENQRRNEKLAACRATLQQELRDHPEARAEVTKEYSSCIQAAVRPATGPTQ